MDKILCASMMCADYDQLANQVKDLDQSGIDYFHCDVMDGTFVPNITMGVQDIKCIRRNTKKMIDCHLMIENPGSKIQLFLDAGCDIIYIHPEAERYVSKTLSMIKQAGKYAGIAINPDTSIYVIEEILNVCDYVMVMTVNPGFAGQKYIEFVTNKINKLVRLKKDYKFKIIVDGACSPQKIKELSDLGVDGFVLGTSALFGKQESYSQIIKELRSI